MQYVERTKKADAPSIVAEAGLREPGMPSGFPRIVFVGSPVSEETLVRFSINSGKKQKSPRERRKLGAIPASCYGRKQLTTRTTNA